MTRRILVVTHANRPDLPELAAEVSSRLREHDIEVHQLAQGWDSLEDDPEVNALAAGAELVVILGGDGTILRGAEVSRRAGIPLLGINHGRVGFLAEAEREETSEVVQRIVARDYTVEQRMTLEVAVFQAGRRVAHTWALNEASVEKSARERMLELTVEVDGRPLSTWGCDGVVIATPTGSTAYAFSGGGPIVWPEVQALLVVPISAHALFARPIVLGPDTRVAVEVVAHATTHGVMWCDGRRSVDLPPGARIEVRRSETPVLLARLSSDPFTDRLVAKFELPVTGWRGKPDGTSA
ncbi:NAD kinase [Ornithinimicrobium ciconiae]|uniref:NAD kinase n=1 Tax=Ornithinimicrobium ciconiae TaxID=2594265 RepID=A0A516GBN5_9MICO|nr:NAD kinase [Ornithinimicrobium ciconiae]QDO88937.1 NAD kinase [Ornithinimicrobium ciconiae]